MPPPPPPEYTDLQYIESTGTQYIDTGYKPNNNSYLSVDFQSTQGTIGYNWLAYVRWGGSPTYDGWGVYDGSSGNYRLSLQMGNYNNNNRDLGPNTSAWLLTRHEAVIDGPAFTGKIGTYNTTFNAETFQSTYDFLLFAFNNQGGIGAGKMKLYGCVIRENGVDVMNLVPKLRTADSKPGLYDTVNDVFYTNDGTGEFLYA